MPSARLAKLRVLSNRKYLANELAAAVIGPASSKRNPCPRGLKRVDEWRRQRKLLAPTFSPSASTFWISAPRQEHQVGRFLGVFEERLTRRPHLCTHRQTAAKVEA